DEVLLLPNTAGARTAEDAVRVARLARAGGLPDWVKLEVIPDPRNLLPDPVGTLEAAETLVAEGFTVLPYMFPDPQLARRLEEAGCATVMPLASPIGSGRGLKLQEAIRIMVEEAGVPVVVDAGVGAPSEAADAMGLGGETVARLLERLGLSGPYALVERNGEPVERSGYGEVVLGAGDRILVARPVAGG